jgi:hypothetical protein
VDQDVVTTVKVPSSDTLWYLDGALWYLDGNKPKRGGYHPKGPCKPVQFHHRDIPKEQVSRRGTESMATFDKVDE